MGSGLVLADLGRGARSNATSVILCKGSFVCVDRPRLTLLLRRLFLSVPLLPRNASSSGESSNGGGRLEGRRGCNLNFDC